MSSNIISYNLIKENIVTLSNEEKDILLSKVLSDLQMNLINYFNKFSEQEIYLFKFRETKEISENKSSFYSIIQKLIEEIKKSNNYQYIQFQPISFLNTKKDEVKLNYEEICGIVNFIIAIFDNMIKKKKEEVLYDFAFKSIFPKSKKVIEINSIQLSKLLGKTQYIKNINICLSNEKIIDNIEIKEIERCFVDINVIQLFCFFFKPFFKDMLNLSIDLNIYEINGYFNREISPYKIKKDEIIKFGNYYQNIILGNLILMKYLTYTNRISFKMFDSYQIEMHELMNKYFSNTSSVQNDRKTNSSQNINNNENTNYTLDYQNKLPFFEHLVSAVGIDFLEFNINFNSLDPLLFNYVNILMMRFSTLSNISLKFFEFNKVNIRKILINSYYYNLYSKSVKNPVPLKYSPENNNIINDNDYKIYYDYIYNINNRDNRSFMLIKEEIIFNELFPYFNHNLNTLLLILEKNMKDNNAFINNLKLDFTSTNKNCNDLSTFSNYNMAIICFIYNLFHILDKNKQIKLDSIDLLTDDFTEEKEFLIRNVKDKIPYYKDTNSFNLNDLKITRLYINFPNISIILPFKYFPNINLQQLIVENLSYHDFDDLVNILKNNSYFFKKLKIFKIKLNIMIEDIRNNLKILLKDCISKDIIEFELTISNTISYDDIIDIITCIKKNKNNKAIFYIYLSNNELSPHIKTTFFDTLFKKFKIYSNSIFHKRNIVANSNCCEQNSFSFNIKILNKCDINYYLKIIYCFNKIYNKKEKKKEKRGNQKIFENIFYYIGKFQTKNKGIIIKIL